VKSYLYETKTDDGTFFQENRIEHRLSGKWVHLAYGLEGKSPNASSNPFEMAEELKGLKKEKPRFSSSRARASTHARSA
jgi:hypothetical protein